MTQELFSDKTGMAFLFIPMDSDDADSFQSYLRDSSRWELEDERKKNDYMYRYITDKMDPDKPETCLYLHYRLTRAECERRGWGDKGTVFRISGKEQGDPDLRNDREDILFRISGVHLYAFRTKISILALLLRFAKDDAEYAASGLYYLKKVQRAVLECGGMQQTSTPATILETVKTLFEQPMAGTLRYFPYLNEGTERANTMSLAFTTGENWKEELYFLKNGYRSDGFPYSKSLDLEDENLRTSDDYVWGVTGENLACLILKRTGHTQYRFYERFQQQYLLTYILLLHRKFDLYKILTDFGIGEQNDLQTLKAYQKLLNSYQTDYAYERITEVPQYHRLYKKIEEKMELAELFADVMEPVSELSSLRMEKVEADREGQEQKMERALAALSFLAVFSALIDCADFLNVLCEDWPELFHTQWPDTMLPRFHFAASLLIVIVAGLALRGILKKRTKRTERTGSRSE